MYIEGQDFVFYQVIVFCILKFPVKCLHFVILICFFVWQQKVFLLFDFE